MKKNPWRSDITCETDCPIHKHYSWLCNTSVEECFCEHIWEVVNKQSMEEKEKNNDDKPIVDIKQAPGKEYVFAGEYTPEVSPNELHVIVGGKTHDVSLLIWYTPKNMPEEWKDYRTLLFVTKSSARYLGCYNELNGDEFIGDTCVYNIEKITDISCV